MPLPVMTYADLINSIKNWILNNCINFESNFSNLPAVFKSGYSVKTRYAGNDLASANHQITITKFVSSVPPTTFENDFQNFLTSINLTDKLNTNLADSEFFNLVNNIISFCSTKLCFAVSQYSTSKYIIYNTTNTYYLFLQKIDTSEMEKLIDHNDITMMLIAIIDIIKQNIRSYSCKYSITLS